LGKSFAVHSYKGGTGKSCITASLAAQLALQNKNVCLFDYDLRGPSLHALFTNNTPKYWLNDYLDGICQLSEVTKDISSIAGTKGKFLITLADPSPKRIQEMLTKDRRWEQNALQYTMKAKEELFSKNNIDYIFFDTSPGLQYSSINAIAVSDAIILLTKIDAFDFAGTTRMIPEIYQLLDKKVGVIINNVVSGIEKYVEKTIKGVNLPILGKIPCYADESMYLLTKVSYKNF
jgi:septum site-determining protein MinD